MRKGRIKLFSSSAYYHLYNRCAGMPGEFPFGDVEKEFMVDKLKSLCAFYMIEVVSYCFMSNHFHLVVRVPLERPSLVKVLKRYEAYYGDTQPDLSKRPEEEQLAVRDRMFDISAFMKDFQQGVTVWFNRVAHVGRRGGLWADRFKSTVLEFGNALWSGVKYVELNPVRAGMVTDAADYRFCSWGAYCGSGRHPFGHNFWWKQLTRDVGDDGAPIYAYRRLRT